MKKTVLVISIIIIIIAMLLGKYNDYKNQLTEISEFNVQYEQYKDKQVYGTDVASVINKAVDNNESTLVEKDENENYIQNDTTSVYIEVKINDLEENTIYTMETLYNGGMSQFVQYYGTILFECSSIEYNSEGKVKYMLFEQITS